MKGITAGTMFVLAAMLPVRPAAADAERERIYQAQVRPFLKQYCSGCHNARVKTGGVAVDGFLTGDSIAGQNGTWERILRKLRTSEMPPAGLPRAPQPAVNDVIAFVGGELDRAAAAKPDPGRVTAHRLNRAEYNNAVRDLLAVDWRPADDFPADDSGYGFDNIADVLSLPPVLMEKYLSVAGKVSRQALGRARLAAVLDRYNAPRDRPQNERISEAAPVGSRGGIEVEHRFPADATYLLRARLRFTPDPKVPELLDFRVDGKLLKRAEVKFTASDEDEELRRFEIKVPVSAGRRKILLSFLRDDSKNENPSIEIAAGGKPRRNPIAVDWLEVGGPFDVTGPGDTPSRRAVLSCKPASAGGEEPCASSILTRLARRAWRRPVTAAETARLMRFYRMGRADSGEFEGGVELGLKSILVSPHFLFRVEREPAVRTADVYPISDLELASRLSFFLWSSIPDETLLRLAERGALRRPEVLESQVRAMLLDPRASALTANFAGQWLHLRNLASMKPDPALFPEFDNDLREAMQRETELFFEAVAREDRSVLDFLDAPFTYLNQRLAAYYGVAGVEGRRLRRVNLPPGVRGGVLTMASVLTVTSYPTRTSSVIRGKWVLENLLGAPPPPPPPDIPALQESAVGKTMSMRQQVEQHRADPSCAACHAKMDPIGFALENYDAVGRWRTRDGGFAIDASGKLPSGESFQNAAELKRILRANPEEFVLCFTEKLLTYALGRGVERNDKPLVRAITRAAAGDGYKFSSIVLAIARSAPFQQRSAAEVSLPTKEGRHVGE